LAELKHPGYFYSGKIFPGDTNQKFHVITACFDGKLRFWSVDLRKGADNIPKIYEKISLNDYGMNKNIDHNNNGMNGNTINSYYPIENNIDQKYPNTLTIVSKGSRHYLYVGDSYGEIHIYELSKDSGELVINAAKSMISINECLGASINCIYPIEGEYSHLIVHS